MTDSSHLARHEGLVTELRIWVGEFSWLTEGSVSLLPGDLLRGRQTVSGDVTVESEVTMMSLRLRVTSRGALRHLKGGKAGDRFSLEFPEGASPVDTLVLAR